MSKVAREKRPATSKAGVRQPSDEEMRQVADALMALVMAEACDERTFAASGGLTTAVDCIRATLNGAFEKERLRDGLIERLVDAEKVLTGFAKRHDAEFLDTEGMAEACWLARRAVDPRNQFDRSCVECGRWMRPSHECPEGHCRDCHGHAKCEAGAMPCACGHEQALHTHADFTDLATGGCEDAASCGCTGFTPAPDAPAEVAA